MSIFRKRWVAVALCVVMIAAAFAIGQEKAQQSALPQDADTLSLLGIFAVQTVGGITLSLLGTVFFIGLITVLCLVLCAVCLIRAAKRRADKKDPGKH